MKKMTKKQVINYFLNTHRPFNDYWEMQLTWEIVIDNLCKDKEITQKQRDNFGNPCSPDTFKNFNKKFKGALNV